MIRCTSEESVAENSSCFLFPLDDSTQLNNKASNPAQPVSGTVKASATVASPRIVLCASKDFVTIYISSEEILMDDESTYFKPAKTMKEWSLLRHELSDSSPRRRR